MSKLAAYINGRSPFAVALAGGALLVVLAASLTEGALQTPLLVAAFVAGGSLGLLLARQSVTQVERREKKSGNKQSEIRSLHTIISALELPAILLDESQRIAFHNRPARELFPSIAEGQPLALISRAPELNAAIERATVTGRAASAETAQRLPFDRQLIVTATPIAGTPSVLLQFRDVSEQSRLTQLRSDFIANASHELRTPLASIKGFIETLQGSARDDENARQRFLAIMEAQAGRMNRILDDLLSLSRIEMRAHLYPEAPVEVTGIVRDALKGLEPLAAKAGASVHLQAPVEPCVVRGDRDELEQVVQNLVHNAIKYGHAGGRVDVLVQRRNVTTPLRRAAVEIAVRDNGPGIAKEHLPRLTERFYRVDAARSREKGGTGLGLAIVKHILNRHRGELEITSELGKGSTFTVTLDAVPGDAELDGATNAGS